MKYDRSRFRRVLALLLVLALSSLLPALAGETEAPEQHDEILNFIQPDGDAEGAMVNEVTDLYLPEDAIGENAGASGLPGQVVADAIPADDIALRTNTSVPAEDYYPELHSFKVGRRERFTMMVGDTLEVVFPRNNGKAWKVSDPSVLLLNPYTDSYSAVVTAMSPGKSVLKLTLTTGKVYEITVTVKDPYALLSLRSTRKSLALLEGKDLDLAKYLVLKPVYAKAGFTYRSSDSLIASVNKKGIVTARSPGSCVVTITSSNGLRKKIKVRVNKNQLKLYDKPSNAFAARQGKKWTLTPRTLALKGDGSLYLKLSLSNGSGGKITSLRDLDLSVSLKTSQGENLIAHAAFSKVSACCDRNRNATVKLTFPVEGVYYSGINLTDLDPSKLVFRLYSAPTAKIKGSTLAYNPTRIEVTGDPSVSNPVTYRALLVSENDFYLASTPGIPDAWEHSTRNRNDVNRMKRTLKKVRTPDGTRYSVRVKHNTSHSELDELIRSTFADADDNDVSLFFIATHGDSDDYTPDDQTGALLMASSDETFPEYYYLSELRKRLLKVPGKVIVILESCGSGSSIVRSNAARAALSANSFDTQVVDLFREADPGLIEGDSDSPVANIGELRRVNKFYVLCCSECREESWGIEDGGTGSYNFFTKWLCQGIGKSGSMPADRKYAGNKNGMADLHELYRYIAGVGNKYPIHTINETYYQHVRVYPANVRFAMFQ